MNNSTSSSNNNNNNRLSNNSNSLSRRQSEQNLISLSQTLATVVYTAESLDVINSLVKEPESLDDYQILVVNINDKSLDCPGMLSEEKVIKEYQATLTQHSQLLLPLNKSSSSGNNKKQNRPHLKTSLEQNLLDFKVLNFFRQCLSILKNL